MSVTPTTGRLYRSTTDKRIAGVCGGLAEHFGWDPAAVRLAVALSILLPGPQVIAYLIAWLVLPTDEQLRAQAGPPPGWQPGPQQGWQGGPPQGWQGGPPTA